MIGFVVPIKPRAVSRNWELETALLRRTVRSLCAQTDRNFRVVIVHNERPIIDFDHQNVTYVQYSLPQVFCDDIEDLDYVLKYYPRAYAERMMDKGKKIHFGCAMAIEQGCRYLMAVDSDDLVSNDLADFVNRRANLGGAGWRIRKGYIFEEGSRFLMKEYEIQNINGSTHIIRKDLVTIPDFSTNVFWNYNLFEAHGYTAKRITDFHGEYLEDYPNFGVVYVVHSANYSNISTLAKIKSPRKILKRLLRGTFVSARIKAEFGLYPLHDLAHPTC